MANTSMKAIPNKSNSTDVLRNRVSTSNPVNSVAIKYGSIFLYSL